MPRLLLGGILCPFLQLLHILGRVSRRGRAVRLNGLLAVRRQLLLPVALALLLLAQAVFLVLGVVCIFCYACQDLNERQTWWMRGGGYLCRFP
jgi:hypothetical protein